MKEEEDGKKKEQQDKKEEEEDRKEKQKDRKKEQEMDGPMVVGKADSLFNPFMPILLGVGDFNMLFS